MSYCSRAVSQHKAQRAICLNRPERHNAIDEAMMSEWQQAFIEANTDAQVVSQVGGPVNEGAHWLTFTADEKPK